MISVDDAIFYGSLVTCISLGNYYKKINDADMKRNYGAGLGLLIACLICGQYIYHTIFMVWGNVIIIKCCHKRYIHQVSLAFTWAYLIILHFNMPLYIYWILQVLAMRLVGLAFEVYNMNKTKLEPKLISSIKNTSSSAVEDDTVTAEPSSTDIIAYAYFFIGLHKGPYYRWKIFNDNFTMPFGDLGDSRVITERKLKKVLLCAVTYGILSLKYSTEVFYTDDFYKTYGTDFRYLYNIPLLMMYFLKTQIIMLLCTSVCTETGFGVYPAKCQPVPGHGPTTNFNLLKLPIGGDNSALDQEYNFSMLKCFDNEKLLIGPKMKDTLRNWNLSHRYWFWTYTHQSFWKDQKEVRSAFSFLAWIIWFGPSIPKLIMATTLWVYVRLEAEYNELYDTRNESRSIKLPMDIGYSIMRLFCLIYLTPCLVIPDTDVVFRYYHSIFWIYHIVLLFMILLSILIYKSRDSGNTSI